MEKTIKIPDIITFTVVVKNDTVGIKNDTVGFKITFLNPEFTKWIFVNPYTSNDIRIISPKWHFGTMTTLVLVIQELLTYHVNKPHEHAERIISAIKSAAEAFRKNKNQITTDLAEFGLKIGDPIRANTVDRAGFVIAYDDLHDALHVANAIRSYTLLL